MLLLPEVRQAFSLERAHLPVCLTLSNGLGADLAVNISVKGCIHNQLSIHSVFGSLGRCPAYWVIPQMFSIVYRYVVVTYELYAHWCLHFAPILKQPAEMSI